MRIYIEKYDSEELLVAGKTLFKKSVLFIIYLIIFLLCFLVILLTILGNITNEFQYYHTILFLVFAFTLTVIALKFGLNVFTLRLMKDHEKLSIEFQKDSMVCISDRRYNVVDLQTIRALEMKNGIALIFKRVQNKKHPKKSVYDSIISPYDMIVLLPNVVSEEYIKNIKSFFNK